MSTSPKTDVRESLGRPRGRARDRRHARRPVHRPAPHARGDDAAGVTPSCATRGLRLRRPDLTLATMDHSTPTRTEQVFGGVPIAVDSAAKQVQQLEINCAGVRRRAVQPAGQPPRHRARHRARSSGVTQPGKTIVCGDSHTSHARRVRRPRLRHRHHRGRPRARDAVPAAAQAEDASRSTSTASCAAGVTAKDLILAIIGKIGVVGGTGHVLEYRGAAIRALSMDERMTICNMSIEAGARAGMIAPDDTTFAYLAGRAARAAGRGLGRGAWRAGASCPPTPARRSIAQSSIDAATLVPMVTYGTHPGMVAPDRRRRARRRAMRCSRRRSTYMGLEAGEPLLGNVPVNVVFVGSCTNGRLSDLRNAARVLRGRKLAEGVQMLVVPGSQQRQARRRGRRPRPGVHRRRRRVARERLLDVPRHERRPRAAGPVLRQHQQPQLRRPPGHGRAHAARQPADRRGRRGHRGRVTDPREFVELSTCPPSTPIRSAHRRAARRPTSTPTRSSRRASSRDHVEGRLRQAPVRRLALRRRRAAEAGLRAEPARGRRARAILVAGPQLRLRLVARARAVGAARLRLPAPSISTEFADIFRTNSPEERPAAGRSSTSRRTPGCWRNPGAEVSHRRRDDDARRCPTAPR